MIRGISGLDWKLGARMLVKYPGLSFVSVVGMAIAIAIGSGAFSIIAAVTTPGLPLPDGDRIVALRNTVVTEPSRHQSTWRDYTAWREAGTVEHVAAFTTLRRNLVVPGAPVELVRVARVTASMFRTAQTEPLMGRALLEDDERTDARVVVIGYEQWQNRFSGDARILGRNISLGADEYTVVGVMPEGFRFPVDDGFWIPLAPSPSGTAGDLPVGIVGRLGAGATLESAQAEFAAIGARLSNEYPDTHAQLRARVIPYTRTFADIDEPGAVWSLGIFQVIISLLLVVVAVNVSILVYARTATRAGEIAVRSALGASRARVISLLFTEAFVLSGTAALLGLAFAGFVLGRLQTIAERELGEFPFWIQLRLSPGVIAYALLLAILGAAIAGVVPALKATSRRVQLNLQQLSGRSGRMQLGRAWTALIVGQVAVAVAILPLTVHFAQDMIGFAAQGVAYPAEEFLEARLAFEQEDAVPGCDGRLCDATASDTTAASARVRRERFHAGASELVRRLGVEPAVAGFTVVQAPRSETFEVSDAEYSFRDPVVGIDQHYFDLYGMPIIAGRDFSDADAQEGASVIVNQVMADNLGRSNVLNRSLRFVQESETGEVDAGPWLNIVGIVQDYEADRHEPTGKVYILSDVTSSATTLALALRLRTSPSVFAPRLREIAAAVDPLLQLEEVKSAATREAENRQVARSLAFGTASVTLSVLLLSAAGIYAMMSFTVARRRREIGIRAALGADARRVLGSIFARATAQLGAGIMLGIVGALALEQLVDKGPVRDGNMLALPLVAALMTMVGLLASLGPARNGLAVQPNEVLREE